MGKPNMQLSKGIEEQENAISRKKQMEEKMKQREEKIKEAVQKTGMQRNIQKPRTVPEGESMLKEDENKADAKQKKQTFSFRAPLDDIAAWRAYSTATGMTMENMGVAAMNEYLKNHSLSGTDQVIFDAMKKKNKNM